MTECTCVDRNKIPSTHRIDIFTPTKTGIVELDKMLTYNKDCTIHGWYEITEEQENNKIN